MLKATDLSGGFLSQLCFGLLPQVLISLLELKINSLQISSVLIMFLIIGQPGDSPFIVLTQAIRKHE